ncbi:MAG: ATP synthase F1 subunit delta [Clostridia bacterium]|nr:ATP synthase F1 subunit delta [Clostridia bacterium]
MQINREYAEALFLLSAEENCKEEIAEALSVMETTFMENPAYMELLSSPAIPVEERLTLIDHAFSSLPQYAVSFLKLLCERTYIRSFPEMVKTYRELVEDAGNVSTAKVTSAVELTEEEVETLTQKLETMYGHTIVVETEVDSSLLGGIVIEIDGKVIDASLRRRLSDVKDVIGK